MHCPKCGTFINADVCPDCGWSINPIMASDRAKNSLIKKIAIVVAGIVGALVLFGIVAYVFMTKL